MSAKPTQKTGYIFGPVPSRRLGRSLGIDLIPSKTCTYDCLYCQVGRTTQKTIERKSWISIDEIITELKGKLSTKVLTVGIGVGIKTKEPPALTASGSSLYKW